MLKEMLPSIIYGAVFMSVVLSVNLAWVYSRDVARARRKVNERLDLMARGVSREQIMSQLRRPTVEEARNWIQAQFADRLHQAGVRIAPGRFVLMMAGVTAAIAIVFPLVAGLFGKFPTGATLLLVLIFAGGIGFGIPIVFLNMKGARRMKKFDAQFPVALDIFVRGLRAGHPVSAALHLLTTEMGDPIGSEFGLVTDEVNYGLTLKQALENLADRIRTQDVQMFVVCVGIQAETGGNLAEILEGLSKVIRERAAMVLKVRALASEGKMSGVMLSILPIFTFCMVFFNSPSFYLNVADDPIFMPGFIGITFWYITGVICMKKLTVLKV